MPAPSKLYLRCSVNLSSPSFSVRALSSPEERPQSSAFSDVAQALASAGISFRFKAVGQSMYPTILSGEMLHVEPISEHKLGRGDIVLFRSNGKFRAHRIVHAKRDKFITRGDASLQDDGVVRRAEVLGLVVAKESRETGKLVSLAGLAARTDFRFRCIRARVGRALRRQASAEQSVGLPMARSKLDS